MSASKSLSGIVLWKEDVTGVIEGWKKAGWQVAE